MVAYGAMEGERIYIGGSLYVAQECQNVEGVLPNRIFTHEDAKMLRPRNIFRKKITKQDGSEDEPLGSDTSSSSPSLTTSSNVSTAEEREKDGESPETEFEISKTLGSKRKEKVVHRILCEDDQDIQVVEVGDYDEPEENQGPLGPATIATPVTPSSSMTPATTIGTVGSSATAPKKSRIDKLCEKLRENSSFGKSEDVKYTNQIEDIGPPSKNNGVLGKEPILTPKKWLPDAAESEAESSVTPSPLPPPLPPPSSARPAIPTLDKPDGIHSPSEKEPLKLLRHHLKKESTAPISTSFAESDMKRESYIKSPEVCSENAKPSPNKCLSMKAKRTSELAAKLDIILPVTYTASLKKSKSRDGLSACPIVLTAVRHRLKECWVVLHDCQISVKESCSALLFEQKTYKCCQSKQNEKPSLASAMRAPKQTSEYSRNAHKSERKRTRPKIAPSLPSFHLPAPQAPPMASSSLSSSSSSSPPLKLSSSSSSPSLAPQTSSWTVSSLSQQPPLKAPRVTSPTPTPPSSVFPLVAYQPQTALMKSPTPSSVPQLIDDSKKAYPLLTQALTSIGSISHTSAPHFRQELYLSSNSAGTDLLSQRPLSSNSAGTDLLSQRPLSSNSAGTDLLSQRPLSSNSAGTGFLAQRPLLSNNADFLDQRPLSSNNAGTDLLGQRPLSSNSAVSGLLAQRPLSSNSAGTGLLGQRALDPPSLSSVSHSQFMPASQEMMYVKPDAGNELRSSIFSSQFTSFMDHVNRPLHPQEYATEPYPHSKPQFPKWLHLQNQLLSYD